MSTRVSIDDLFDQIETWGTAAVITSSPDGSRVVAVNPRIDNPDGGSGGDDDWGPRFRFVQPGRSTLDNVLNQPAVALYFSPHAGSNGYSLIVDGSGAIDGEDLIVRPSSAVLHRPAAPN